MTAREPLWRRYLRFLGPDTPADVDDELRFHLDQLERDAVASGMDANAARSAARARFGNVEHVRRELRGRSARRRRRAEIAELWRDVAQDIRIGLRKLWQEPGFTCAVVGILGLGIGATTAVFSTVDAALLRPLPFTRPDRLVSLRDVGLDFDFSTIVAAGARQPRKIDMPKIGDAWRMRDVFAGAAGYAAGGLNLDDARNPLRVRVGVVTASFFSTLGVRPAQGRTFTNEEGRPGGGDFAILSYALWRGQFGAGPVVGRRIPLNGKSYEIVGVMPPAFGFPAESELWIPLTDPMTSATFEAFGNYLPTRVIARLADGVTTELANARMTALWRERVPEHLTPSVVAEGAVGGLQQELVGTNRKAMLVLLGATGLLLLLACANVTNLLLSRAVARRREVAVRAVLGATRGRLMRQLLTETTLLALVGMALGLLMAPAGLGVARGLLPDALAGVAPARLDLRVLCFAGLLALVTSLVFGLWPAFGAARSDMHETIKSGGGWGATTGGAGRARRMLAAAEIALALVLLSGTGLMLKSFSNLIGTDTGFRPEEVGSLEIAFPKHGSGRGEHLRTIDGILDRLSGMPGITAAGVVNNLPLSASGGMALMIGVPGHPDSSLAARYLIATAGYFPAMGIALVKGRLMTAADDSLAPKVVVISEAIANALWPRQNPIGQTLESIDRRTVIGVVRNVRDGKLEQGSGAQMYFPAYEMPAANFALVARGPLPPNALLARLRDAVRATDPSQAVFHVRMMDEVVSASVAPRRAQTILISTFGALGLLLAAFGVYGIVAYGIAQRTRELGIRAALGATGSMLVRHVAREGLALGVTGIVAGMLGAWAATRLLASLLFAVSPTDPWTFALAALTLFTTVALATLIPARRAARLDVMDVMRTE